MNNLNITISIKYSIWSIVILFLVSCDIKESDIEPEKRFTKIYFDDNFDLSYYPVDIKQTIDGNYYILSGVKEESSISALLNTNITKIDMQGKYLWDKTLEESYVNPIADIQEINDEYYFFCMDKITLGTHVMKISDDLQSAESVSSFSKKIYPLNLSMTPDNHLLLLYYNRSFRTSVLCKMDFSFSEIWENGFGVVEDAEEKLVNHITKRDRQFPFFIGYIEDGNVSHYFINSFYNYNFSWIFIKADDGASTGWMNGNRYNGAISSAVHLGGNKFAISRYSFDDNYLLPQQEVDYTSVLNTEQLPEKKLQEIKSEAIVKVKRIVLNNTDVIVYCTSTNNHQIVLYVYDEMNGNLLTTKYISSTNPANVANMWQTSDNGIIIVAQTYVAGRFPRISAFKLSEDEFELF